MKASAGAGGIKAPPSETPNAGETPQHTPRRATICAENNKGEGSNCLQPS